MSNAVTVVKPSGTQTIHDSTSVQINQSGALVCGQAVQDYVPFAVDSLLLWTDFGDVAPSQSRAGAVTFPRRPGQFAAGIGSLNAADGFVVQTGALQKQNGRNVLCAGCNVPDGTLVPGTV